VASDQLLGAPFLAALARRGEFLNLAAHVYQTDSPASNMMPRFVRSVLSLIPGWIG
jgi:hypothetical protein